MNYKFNTVKDIEDFIYKYSPLSSNNCSLSSSTKNKIISQFKNYIEEILGKTTNLEDSVDKSLKDNIIITLLLNLEIFLTRTDNIFMNDENIIFELEDMMKKTTKDYYIDYLKNNNFGLNNLKHDDISNDYFNNSSELDKKIYMVESAYEFAGYNSKKDFKLEQFEEEICSLLNISKLKFCKANLRLAWYIIKAFNREVLKDNVKTK